MVEPINVGILGISGLGKGQLLRLCEGHPGTNLTYVGDPTLGGKSLFSLFPDLGLSLPLSISPLGIAIETEIEAIARLCPIVVIAAADGFAQTVVPGLLSQGCKVLDLSADYRFWDLDTYQRWYGGQDRADHAIVQQAIYGLPEIYGPNLPQAHLVACPGSYATASLLALAPLLKQGLIDLETIVIDAKSGFREGEKGAIGETNLNSSSTDKGMEVSIEPYNVVRHVCTPEVEQICRELTRQPIVVQFTPHWIPKIQGMLVTVYAQLRDPGLVREDLITIYEAFYRQSPWIRVLPNGSYPNPRSVYGTNLCDLGIEVDPRTDRVVVMAAIDDEIKGSAGQALQCLNLMMGWDEQLGLPYPLEPSGTWGLRSGASSSASGQVYSKESREKI